MGLNVVIKFLYNNEQYLSDREEVLARGYGAGDGPWNGGAHVVQHNPAVTPASSQQSPNLKSNTCHSHSNIFLCFCDGFSLYIAKLWNQTASFLHTLHIHLDIFRNMLLMN